MNIGLLSKLIHSVMLAAEDITFDEAPSPQHPKINTNALIRCKVSGEPKPEVTWRYHGTRVNFTGQCLIAAACSV